MTDRSPALAASDIANAILAAQQGGIAASSARRMVVNDIEPATGNIIVEEYGTGDIHDEPYARLAHATGIVAGDHVLVLEILGRGGNMGSTRIVLDKIAVGPDGPAGSFQPLDADLTAIAALTGTGILSRTAANTWATRSLAAGSTKVSITNPAGLAGNPTIDVAEANININNLGGTPLAANKGGTGGGANPNQWDLLVGYTGNEWARLNGSTANGRRFLRGTGNGSSPTGVAWDALTAADMPTGIDAANIGGGSVSNTEFGYLDGVSSAIQTQIDGKAPVGAKYIVQTADATLTGEQALGALATGILKSTTSTGVLSIATGSDLPTHSHAQSDITGLVTDLSNKQPLDSDLTTIAGLTATTDNVIQSVGSAWASRTPAQLKSTLALVKGDVGLGNVDNTSDATKWAAVATITNKSIDASQLTGTISNARLDAELQAIAGLTSAADSLPYFTGSGTASLATLTSYGRSLIDDANAATAQATLGLVIGTNVQAWDADLDAVAAMATTGIAVRVAAGNWVQRSIAVGSSMLSIANASGAANNPTLDVVPANIAISALGVPSGSVAWNSQKITGLADPTAAQDAATKAYVDAVASGLDLKASVRVASTANINTASPGATIDGVSMASGDRVLLKNQSTGSQNGIYVWNGAAVAMTRATDADTSAEVTSGMFTWVAEGTVNADQGFGLVTNDPITLGTTSLSFSQISGLGQISVTSGLTKTGNTLGIDTAVVARKSDNLSVFASTTSAQLLALISDETGTGSLVFGSSPTIVTPTIASLTNMQHSHQNAAGGGSLDAAAIGSGTIANARLDAELQALAGLTSAADALPYFTGSGTASVTTLSSFARTLIDDANQATMQTTLGLVPGTNVQAYDAELAAIAGLTSAADRLPYFSGAGTALLATFTAAARSLVDDPDTATMRTTLGLAIGTDVQAYSANLASLAGITGVADRGLYFTGAGALAMYPLTSFSRTVLNETSATGWKNQLALDQVNNTSDASKAFAASQITSGVFNAARLAASPTTNYILMYNGTNPVWATPALSGNIYALGGGSTDGAVVVFDGTSGNLIKMATASGANAKITNGAHLMLQSGSNLIVNSGIVKIQEGVFWFGDDSDTDWMIKGYYSSTDHTTYPDNLHIGGPATRAVHLGPHATFGALGTFPAYLYSDALTPGYPVMVGTDAKVQSFPSLQGWNTPPGPVAINATNVTALATQQCLARYLGQVPYACTSIVVNVQVATAGSSITWSEAAIATSNGPTGASLTTRGYTSLNSIVNSTGSKSITISVSNVNAGDHIYLLLGAQASTVPQYRATIADEMGLGVTRLAATTRPSTMSAPTSFSTSTATTGAVMAAFRYA